jgi:F-type H+-transporting ATPase subunit b
VERRTKAVEQRIAQAETQAIAEVRSRAIDVATIAAARILAERARGKAGDELLERSIAAVRKNLN